MKTLLYLSYGRGPHVNELLFSIYSAKRLMTGRDPEIRTVVYTDCSELFGGTGAEIVPMTSAELEEWSGPHEFVWRRKVKAVQHALSASGGPVAYIDGDTYFASPPAELFRKIAPGRAVMHLREGHLDKYQAAPIADFLATRPPLRDLAGRPWPITEDTPMWNAGVIGVHPADAALVDEVLNLVDQLYPGCGHVHCEQFAFSAVLQLRTRLLAAEDVVQHYWAMERRAPFRARLNEAFANGFEPARALPLLAHLPAEPFRIRARRRLKGIAIALGLHKERRHLERLQQATRAAGGR